MFLAVDVIEVRQRILKEAIANPTVPTHPVLALGRARCRRQRRIAADGVVRPGPRGARGGGIDDLRGSQLPLEVDPPRSRFQVRALRAHGTGPALRRGEEFLPLLDGIHPRPDGGGGGGGVFVGGVFVARVTAVADGSGGHLDGGGTRSGAGLECLLVPCSSFDVYAFVNG